MSKLLIWATRLGPQIHFGRSASSQNKHCSGCEQRHGHSALAKGPRRNLTFKMSIRSKALGSQSSLGCQSSSRNGDLRCLQDAAACWGPPRRGMSNISNMLGWEGSLPPTLCSFQLGIYSFLFSLRYPAPPKKYLYQLFASTTTQKKANKLKMHRLRVTRGGGDSPPPGIQSTARASPRCPIPGARGSREEPCQAEPSCVAPAAPCPGGAARLGAASAPR